MDHIIEEKITLFVIKKRANKIAESAEESITNHTLQSWVGVEMKTDGPFCSNAVLFDITREMKSRHQAEQHTAGKSM